MKRIYGQEIFEAGVDAFIHKKVFVIGLVLFYSVLVAAQVKVRGRVCDTNGRSIEYVSISINSAIDLNAPSIIEEKLPYAYISHDNGKTYKEFHPESMHLDKYGDCWSFIDAMVQNPHNDKEILVLNMYGLWKSTDFGATWTPFSHLARLGDS